MFLSPGSRARPRRRVTAVTLAASSMEAGRGMINGTLVTSVASNVLTVAVKTLAGVDPSASDPVYFIFRDVTAATGDYVVRTVTAALSMTTNAAGATLGTANSVPFRLWVEAFDNAGTVVLALWQSITGGATPTAVASLDESAVQSTTGISGSATAAGTFYTPNGTSLSSKPFRILAYLEWSSGLATAGSYASTPTKIQLFGPGIKKPGDIVQMVSGTTATSASAGSGTFIDTNLTATITPTSAANPIRISGCQMECAQSAVDTYGTLRLRRGTTTIVTLSTVLGYGSASLLVTYAGFGPFWDAPNTTSSTVYKTQLARTAGTSTIVVQSSGGTSAIELAEIMA